MLSVNKIRKSFLILDAIPVCKYFYNLVVQTPRVRCGWPSPSRLSTNFPIPLCGWSSRRLISRRSIRLTLLAPGAQERVLDLFCGMGNFTLSLARRAGQVVGLEGEEQLAAQCQP